MVSKFDIYRRGLSNLYNKRVEEVNKQQVQTTKNLTMEQAQSNFDLSSPFFQDQQKTLSSDFALMTESIQNEYQDRVSSSKTEEKRYYRDRAISVVTQIAAAMFGVNANIGSGRNPSSSFALGLSDLTKGLSHDQILKYSELTTQMGQRTYYGQNFNNGA